MHHRTPPIVALLDIGRRSEVSAGIAIAVVLTLAGTILIAQPGLLGEAEASSLTEAIGAASPERSGLRLELVDLFVVPDDAAAPEAVTSHLDELTAALPAELLAPFAPGRNVLDTPRFTVTEVDGGLPPFPTFLTLRLHPDLGDRATYVAGSPPRSVDERSEDGLATFEMALSVTTADALGLTVGSLLTLGVSDDALLRRVTGPLPIPFLARVAGLVELAPADDPYWFGDARLHRPVINDTNAGADYFAFATYGADQLAAAPFVVDGTTRLRVEQRRDLRPELIDVGNSAATLLTLRTNASTGAVGRLAVSSGLDQILVNAGDRRLTARATTLLATVGLVGVTLATVIQFVRVGAARRRPWVGLVRARGAATATVVTASVVEIVVIATFAGGLAVVLGSLIGGGGMPAEAAVRPLLLLAVGSVLATAVVSTGEARRLAADAGIDAPGRRWRGLGAGLMLVAGVASIVAFAREGLRPEDPWGSPLATLVPVLGPLAVAVAARIVIPRLIDRFSRLGLGLGVGRLVGLRRAASDATALSGLGLVVTIALTIAGLGLAVDRGLTRGIEDAAWLAIGAPMRIDSNDPEVAAGIGSLDSVTLAAQGAMVVRVDSPQGSTDVNLVNLDVALHQLLAEGSPAALGLPDLDGMEPVPVVASSRLEGRPVDVGDELAASGALAGTTLVVVDTRETVLDRTEDWVLIDRSVLRDIIGREPPVSTLYLDATEGDAAAAAAIAAAAGVDLLSRDAFVAGAGNDPLVRAVRWSYLGTALLAMALVAVATVGLVAMTARSRRRDVAVLGLVGSDSHQVHRAARAELMVPVVSATVTGTVLGLVIGRMLDGRLDLSPFAGGLPVSISPTVALAAGCGAITLAMATAAVAVGVRRTVRIPLGNLLRAEDA